MNLDRFIAIVREEMMTANPAGGSGGFSSNPPKPGVDGYDKVMPKTRRRKNTIGLWAGSLKNKKK